MTDFSLVETGDQESIELPSNGIDMPHQSTTESEVATTDLDSVSVDEHRENVLASSTSQSWAGETVVTVNLEEEDDDDRQEGMDGGSRAREAAAAPEKLQDEDQFAEIWYKRWFFKLFPMLRRGGCV